MAVLNEDSLESTVNWMIIANNTLYTAIDFISQLVLVSVLDVIDISRLKNFPFLNEALPMLDYVAWPTIGYDHPLHFITGVFRC